jgi:hypothetical protein
VRLKLGERPARAVRELAGSVAAQVRVAEPVVALDGPAAGQTARGEHGVSLRLARLNRHDEDVRVVVTIQLPLDVGLVQPVGGLAGAQLQVQNGIFIPQMAAPPVEVKYPPESLPAGSTDCQGLCLEDARGRKFAAVNGTHAVNGLTPQGYTCQIDATFRPEVKGTEPVRLVFTATRPVVIEVPFVLKDVPLP